METKDIIIIVLIVLGACLVYNMCTSQTTAYVATQTIENIQHPDRGSQFTYGNGQCPNSMYMSKRGICLPNSVPDE